MSAVKGGTLGPYFTKDSVVVHHRREGIHALTVCDKVKMLWRLPLG